MPNCKVCGHPVAAGTVLHSECLTKLVTEAVEKFCDGYCVWLRACDSQEHLWREHCDACPMVQLMKLAK